MPSHPGVKKLRDMLNRPGFIYALGIWDPYTVRMVSNAVTQELKRVLTNFRNIGASGLPAKEMIAWRKECETLIGLDEMYKVERDTVER